MPTTKSPQEKIEYAERQMQRCWYDLAMAEQAGQSMQALERLYQLYHCALEEYLRLCEQKRQRLAS
jgi:hypothetical protein